MLIRGIYYEAWRPAGKPDKIRSRDEFLTGITTRIAMKQSIDAENAARAVFRTLENHVSPGEIRDVLHVLPEEIRTLWPRSSSQFGRLKPRQVIGKPSVGRRATFQAYPRGQLIETVTKR